MKPLTEGKMMYAPKPINNRRPIAPPPAPKPAGLDGSSDLLIDCEAGDSEVRPVHSLAHSRPHDSDSIEELRSAHLNDDGLLELATDFRLLTPEQITKRLILIRDIAYSVGYEHGGKDASENKGA